MKHLIPEMGDSLKHIRSGRIYEVIDITWSKRLNDYQVSLKDVFGMLTYEPMQQLAKARWQIATPESMNFM